MTVTAAERFDRRNATLFTRCTDASVWWVQCLTCGLHVRVACNDRTAERPHGRLTPSDIHCCTCKARGDHTSCHYCGACLPDYIPWDQRFCGGRRIDTAYCSNACRQRAYRQRRKERALDASEERPAVPVERVALAIVLKAFPGATVIDQAGLDGGRAHAPSTTTPALHGTPGARARAAYVPPTSRRTDTTARHGLVPGQSPVAGRQAELTDALVSRQRAR